MIETRPAALRHTRALTRLPGFALAVAVAWSTPVSAEPIRATIEALRADARQAAGAGDLEGARRAILANLALQPGHASLLAQLAALEAQAGDEDACAAALHTLASTGATRDVSRLREALGPLADAPGVTAALDRIARNAAPVGSVELLASVPQADLLGEGVAVAADGRIFVSSVARRRVLVGTRGAGFSTFADKGLASVFALAVDAQRGLLWAATGVVDQTILRADTPRQSALVAFDLATGEERARLLAPTGARIADFTLAPDGTLYASDAERPRVYRADGPEGELKLFANSDALMSPQGLTWAKDGLYLADYGRGLFRIDASGTVRAVGHEDGISLIGLDGLATDGDRLIGVQNGFNPPRLVAIELDADGDRVRQMDVLASDVSAQGEPTLGVVEADRFIFVANAQWADFDPEDQGAAARPLEIKHVSLR